MIDNLFEAASYKDAGYDICIIGAGAAGLTLATSLDGKGLRVCLLEAGGFAVDEAAQAVFKGEVVGEPFAVEEGRFRVFGGATTRWTGRCAELDAMDFESRDWVADSGWPISLAQLKPYYIRAQSVCGFARSWSSDEGVPVVRRATKLYALQDLRFFVWRYAAVGWRAYQNWGERYLRQVERSADVRLVVGASVVGLEGEPLTGCIRKVRALRPDGSTIKVSAKQFVLCAGGLETVRLLLNFCADPQSGVADPYDVMGRYFMQHPRAVTARGRPTICSQRILRVETVRRGQHTELGLALSPEAQARMRLLNVSAALRYVPDPGSGWEVLKRVTKGQSRSGDGRRLARDAVAIARNGARRLIGRGALLTNPTAELVLDLEQTPDRDSRIMLSSQRCAQGLRRLCVDWRIGEQERRTARIMTRKVVSESARLGLAQLTARDDLEVTGGLSADAMLESYHHLGGARMSNDPRTGVVDSDLRVHGTRNLYVVGGSVMPTGGHANPTFTIVALALRLADALLKPASPLYRSIDSEVGGALAH